MDCGWRLAKFSWRLLRSAPGLIVLGFGLSLAGLLAGYAVIALPRVHGASTIALAGLCFAAMLIATFLQMALTLIADDALDGSRTTVIEALGESRQQFAAIAGWATIATSAQIALLLLGQALPARVGPFVSLAAAAWGFGIVFVVPVLALDLSTPREALRESVAVMRRRWGEQFAGSFGIGGVAALATIAPSILLGVGAHRNHVNPGSGDLAVIVGAVLLAGVFVIAATTFQVFAVTLYRDGTIGLPNAGRYVERRPRRKSWIIRIGLAIAALLLTLAFVGAILGPEPAPKESKVALPARYAAWVTAGMPVVYEGHRVGEVKASEISGEDNVISFEVEAPYRSLESSTSITLSEFEGRPCLLIVPRGQAPAQPSESSASLDAGAV